MTTSLVVVSNVSEASVGDIRRTAASLLTSSVKPSHWLLFGSKLEHERITRMRTMRRSGIVVARETVPLPTGSAIVFMRIGNALLVDALAEVGSAFDHGAAVVYGDSLHRPDRRFEHDIEVRRPGWSPERLRSHNYTGTLIAARHDIVEQAGGTKELALSHEHDRSLRLCELSPPRRLAALLYRSDSEPLLPSLSPPAVEEHCRRGNIDAECLVDADTPTLRVRRRVADTPLVSVVIPTRGTIGRVRGREVVLATHCLAALARTNTYSNLEVIVVFDHDTPPTVRGEIESAARAASDMTTFVDFDRPFNFAEKVNLGAAHARGEHLLLVNDDTEIISPDAIATLLGLLQDPGVAMAGPLLLYEDGLIQSAGHLLNPVPYDLYRHRSPDHVGAQGMLRVQREVSGVIAAFALIRRSAFDSVGGLCTRFPSNYNDVDFSLKLQELGHRVVWTPHARVFHFESRTRSPLLQPFEVETIGRRWRDRLDDDPYSNPHLERYVSIWKQNVVGQESVLVALGPTAPIASK
jgi:GT2 family glycosyltransferase